MTWYVALAVGAAVVVAVRAGLWYMRAAVEWISRPRPDRVSRAMQLRLRLDHLRGQP